MVLTEHLYMLRTEVMSMQDSTYMTLAHVIAKKESKCISRQVGAIIVKYDANGIDRVVSTGYNGTPSKHTNCCDLNAHMVNNGECGNFVSMEAKEAHHNWSIYNELHAEHNAILNSNPLDRQGSTIYITLQPCYTCSLLIVGSGIKRVVYSEKYERTPKEALEVLEKAGVQVQHLPFDFKKALE